MNEFSLLHFKIYFSSQSSIQLYFFFFFALAQSLFALKLYRMYAILSCYHQTKVQLVITSRSKNTWLIKYVWNQINVTFWASYIHSHV